MLSTLCLILLGVTFLFSGFVKIIDPMGMVYKLYSYIVYFEIPIDEYSLILKVSACVLGIFEFLIGVYLLVRIRLKLAIRSAVLMMLFMTPLTLWIYLENPVSDCGCFGEALVLSNAETFYKNVLLLIAALFLAVYPYRFRKFISGRNMWLFSTYTWFFSIVLCLYTLHYLPVIEFTPYKVGANIRKALSGEEGADMRLSNFYLADMRTGKDYSYDVADAKGMVFLLTVPSVEFADDGCCDRINDIHDYSIRTGTPFYMVTASSPKECMQWGDRTGAAYPILFAEETELKAMVRSNPGLILLKDGIIVGKWSNNDLPELDALNADIHNFILNDTSRPLTRLLLWFILPLMLIIFADSLWIGHKFYKHHIYIKRFKLKKIMRKKIVAGNWKMNKNLQEGVALAKELNEALVADKPNCDVIICTPFIHLASVANVIDENLIGLGAENCADKVSGAYTGEVSAEMVKSTGANYVILGHSERRAYYHETPEILKEKVNLALANKLDVIFCIGEVLEEREAGKQNEVVKAQLEGSLFDLSVEEFSHIVLAYEPVWAIGTGKTATADQAEEMHAFIRATIAEKFGAEAAENVSILYGGSCKPSNAKEIFSKVNVDGGLIGGAALKVADFKGIIDAWKA